MYSFEFEQPDDLSSACSALSTEGAQVLAGGQTLIPTLKSRLASPEKLVSLGRIAELSGVSTDNDGSLVIGATTTHTEVASNVATSFPALSKLADNIGDPAVRNRGTIGGSLANNDPSADYPAAALATNATIVTNQRSINADDFFTGIFETSLKEGEVITKVVISIPSSAIYQKFEQPASRFALVGVFVACTAAGVRVAVTGASENGVYRWSEAEAALANDYTASAIESLSVSSEGMISDIHGSSEYRAHLVKVMTRRAVESVQ